MNMLFDMAIKSKWNVPEDNLRKEDKSSAPKLSEVPLYMCNAYNYIEYIEDKLLRILLSVKTVLLKCLS